MNNIKINLRPYREERQKIVFQRFAIAIVASIGVAVAAVFLIGLLYFEIAIGAQEARNNQLDTRIAELDVKIKEIDQLEENKKQLIERKNIVERLQLNRGRLVDLLNFFAYPNINTDKPSPNVQLRSLEQQNTAANAATNKPKEERIKITGVAMNASDVTTFFELMLNRTDLFTQVFLIRNDLQKAGNYQEFVIETVLKSHEPPPEPEKKKPDAKKKPATKKDEKK